MGAVLFSAEELEWRDVVLRRLSWVIVALAPIATALVVWSVQPGAVPTSALVALSVTPIAALCALAGRRHFRMRAYVLLLTLSAGTAAVVVHSGPLPSAAAVFAVIVVAAAVFLGGRAAIGFALLSVATYLALALAQHFAWLPSPIAGVQDTASPKMWIRIAATQGLILVTLVAAISGVLSRYERTLRARTTALEQLTIERERREKAELAVHEAQKHEIVARLAGGIAHDFNNALLVVLAGADLLRTHGALSDDARVELDQITEAASRAAALTRTLLTIGRRDARVPVPTNLLRVVGDAVGSLRRVLPEDIQVETDLAAVPEVLIDPSQANQILLNLALNARDAMPNGGTLTIALHGSDDGGIVLCVRDTGTGIGADVLPHIFEPFFTTKPEGRGTGLGLAMVWTVVDGLGGRVTVHSEQGAGSEFTIHLPKMRESVPARSGQVERAPAAAAVGARVLVVEDQAPVRAVVARALREAGHTVIESATGHEAIEIVRRSKASIDVLCVDAVLPDHASKTLIDAYVEAFPSGKVLVVSGHGPEEVIRQGIEEGRFAFVAKPFAAGALVGKVNELLGVRLQFTGSSNETA